MLVSSYVLTPKRGSLLTLFTRSCRSSEYHRCTTGLPAEPRAVPAFLRRSRQYCPREAHRFQKKSRAEALPFLVTPREPYWSSLCSRWYAVFRYFVASACAFWVLSLVRCARLYSFTARSRWPVMS